MKKIIFLLVVWLLFSANSHAAGDLIVDGNFNLLPPGTIMMYGGGNSPEGWLIANGSAVSRTTYAALFTAIGTAFGAGDGSTTFNLPNFSRRVPVGAGGTGTGVLGNAVGNNGGNETHTLSINEIPSHTHTEIGAQAGSYWGSMPWFISGGSVSGIQTGAAGGGAAHNNMQPSLVVNYIIKY